MKIKKINMMGFKSFSDKMDIPFPRGISAVVGPNGCGKSNIVDAIRWAMGEQSAKLLRGRQMEDVIFNGAKDQKPQGMAEVSVIFENGDGSFPPPFAHDAELAITRRLYRSGESEYLINNVPSRLKDIQEIFMDTGLGNRAYSIIGQGKISAIIDQKPEETRAMIEEAAGITKYKKKVEESKRKIELTKVNLERVEDILSEVERQMRSLKYQASKARQFKSLGEKIGRLELILHSNSYHELEEESHSRMKSTQDLLQEEVGRTTEFSSIQAGIETLNIELDEKDKEIAGLRQAYHQAKEDVNRKESILESMTTEKRVQQELENRLVQEKGEIHRRHRELVEEKANLYGKIEEVKKTSEHLEDEISLLDRRVKGKQEFLKRVREEYEEVKTRVQSGMSKEMSLNQESGYLNNRIGEITDGRSRLENEKTGVDQKMEELVRASRRKNEVREALVGKLQNIETDIGGERQQRDLLEQTKKELEIEIKSAEAELNVCESRLASLKSLTENFEGFKLGVRTIMRAQDLDARRQGRIMGLVADVIQVEPRFEQAVETVLGDKLQYVIVETQDDGKEAVDYLKARAKGKSSFVPIRDVNGNGNHAHGNGFPLLRELVTVPEDYRHIIDLLLGDAALVDDLNKAITAWKGNGRDQCLVTPDGDMVDRTGIISGGKVAYGSHGILARKREIKELGKKRAEMAEALKGYKARLEQMDLQIREKESSLDRLVEEKDDCQEKINDLDKATFQISHELDQLEKLGTRISDELEQKNKEQSRHRDALSKIESELEACKQSREQEELFLREKEHELQECESEFERLREEVESRKMEFGLSREEERGLTREVDRIADFTEEGQQRLKRIEDEIVEAQARYQETVKREESLKGRLHAFYQKLKQAEDAVNSEEQSRNQLQNTIREEDKRGEVLRAELDELKEQIHRAKMEQSEVVFKMNGLVDMVRENMNIDLKGVYREHLKDDFSAPEIREELGHKKIQKERLGEVNLTAIQEHEALKERHTFIVEQREDLLNSIESLIKAIRKINRTSLERFAATFADVDKKLKEVFPILFSGGTASLRLVDDSRPLESGVLVEVKPPGKKLSHMGLLSGGEKALVAMALLFAIYLIKPSPFCLLDEVDAPLDEANVDRFNSLLKEIAKHSQIILVTHNRRSMEIVDRLYGVTMEKQGVSKIISVNLQGPDMN
ncbi:MAG: chromosome segregation protein SMC [Deltaproteobacteria bacterium]|nr:chromosome segregation protein SMC [Deltaproteobacteria bacterium]